MLLWEFLTRLVRRWRVYHRTYEELMQLNDRELSDISITRGDIEAIARNAASRA